ncbi:MAG: hypothetical protein FJ317_08835 [SAR202 cluster bacterium]|nr:hypothetical protein [SAR202 cluster bacterium]
MTQKSMRPRKAGAHAHQLKNVTRRHWERAKSATPDHDVSARKVYSTLGAEYPDIRKRTASALRHRLALPKLRTVQAWVKAWNDEGATLPPRLQWQPWTGDSDDADTAAYLLRLDFVSRTIYQRGLHEDEARWAGRIRAAVTDLDLFVQLFLVREYALVDYWASRVDNTNTRYLDALLRAKPWRPEYGELFFGKVAGDPAMLAHSPRLAGADALSASLLEEAHDRLRLLYDSGSLSAALGPEADALRAALADSEPIATGDIPFEFQLTWRQSYEPGALGSLLMNWVKWSVFPWRGKEFPREITWRDIARVAMAFSVSSGAGPWRLSELIFHEATQEPKG